MHHHPAEKIEGMEGSPQMILQLGALLTAVAKNISIF